jgi:hypothetical protein
LVRRSKMANSSSASDLGEFTVPIDHQSRCIPTSSPDSAVMNTVSGPKARSRGLSFGDS